MLTLAACALLVASSSILTPSGARPPRVLLFTRTAEGAYRHDSIPAGIRAIEELAKEGGFRVTASEDAGEFNNRRLSRYAAVIFLSTNQDVLDPEQEQAFKRYIQNGGGFVGVHAAAGTEREWPWFRRLLGGLFDNHPAPQEADLVAVDPEHPAVSFLPSPWRRFDEWYNFKLLSPRIEVLLELDGSSFEGGKHGEHHPIAWCQEYDGGRSFYTALGHTSESYSEPLFRRHLLEGIRWVLEGGEQRSDRFLPGDDYFSVETLADGLEDPIEMAVLPGGDVLVLERKGALKRVRTRLGQVEQVHQLRVACRATPEQEGHAQECGGLGIALDPGFRDNRLLYIYYSPAEPSVNRLSRFRYDGKALRDERVLLDVRTDRDDLTCHEGGSVAFGPDGLLYVSTGDNTNPFESDGFAPLDEREGRHAFDAQRGPGNSNDLRGSVLRIRPLEDGGYEIPEGNLWPVGTPQTRPEIYAKGCRNPYRISLDPVAGHLYWGDVGPDAGSDRDGNPMGYDEFNQAREAGFFGWPYYRGGRPYRDRDFAAEELGPSFAERLLNDSPNNTGLSSLPPAVAPFFAYPYGDSADHPELGSGGRNAMAGPVCYQRFVAPGLPPYFDRVVLFYDWSRASVWVVRLDEQHRFETLHPFLASQTFQHPIDMELGPDGELFLLEYGSTWWFNTDGKLKRIRFDGFNRRPRAELSADRTDGRLPLAVQFSSKGSFDPDLKEQDGSGTEGLVYRWDFGDGTVSTRRNPLHEFAEPGVRNVTLTVRDPQGRRASRTVTIVAGNSVPKVVLELDAPGGEFAWETPLAYRVEVDDPEEKGGGAEPGDRLRVLARYLKRGEGSVEGEEDPVLSGLRADAEGTRALKRNGCIACHHSTLASVGPSFSTIVTRHGDRAGLDRAGLVDELVGKVRNGGVGTFGEVPMPAHAHLSSREVATMVRAVLDLDVLRAEWIVGENGLLNLPGPPAEPADRHGILEVHALYTDRGVPGLPVLTGRSETVRLRAPIPLIPLTAGRTEAAAVAAQIDGDGAVREAQNVGYYSDPETRLVWNLRVERPGRYRLSIELAAPEDQAGSEFQVEVGDAVFAGLVGATGGWQEYRSVELGTLRLEPTERLQVRFVPLSRKAGFVANVKCLVVEQLPSDSGDSPGPGEAADRGD